MFNNDISQIPILESNIKYIDDISSQYDDCVIVENKYGEIGVVKKVGLKWDGIVFDKMWTSDHFNTITHSGNFGTCTVTSTIAILGASSKEGHSIASTNSVPGSLISNYNRLLVGFESLSVQNSNYYCTLTASIICEDGTIAGSDYRKSPISTYQVLSVPFYNIDPAKLYYIRLDLYQNYSYASCTISTLSFNS